MASTEFDTIKDKFYNRIEKDEKFFNYYNLSLEEATELAESRATNYLLEALDELSMQGNFEVDFSDYDEDMEEVNFEMTKTEIKLIVEMMFLAYMRRDEAKLHAMELNFTPSDLTVFSPANERTSYRNFIAQLQNKVDVMIDNYKYRDRKTGVFKTIIDYSNYDYSGDDN